MSDEKQTQSSGGSQPAQELNAELREEEQRRSQPRDEAAEEELSSSPS